MNRLKNFLSNTFASLLRTFRRYPVETALAAYAFVLFVLTEEKVVEELPNAVIGILPLTLFAAMIVGNLFGKYRAGRICYGLLILLPALSWTMGDAWFQTEQYIITTAVLAPLGLLMARKATDNRRFVGETSGYIEAVAIGGFLALAMLLCFLAVFNSIVYIFGIWQSVDDKVSIYAFALAGLTLWPLLTFSLLDRMLEDETPKSKVIDLLLNRILTPALLIYAAILYLYALQILFTWELPKGGVAYLVFGFGITLFIVKALQEIVTQRRYDWFFDRISLVMLLPLMLFWIGVAQRIGDYGLTESRVYLLICGAVMSAAVGLFLVPRTARYFYIAAVAFLFFAATAYLPGLSAERLSLRSQTRRAERIAREVGILDDHGRIDLRKIDSRTTGRLGRCHELYSSLDYLQERDTSLLSERFGIADPGAYLFAFTPAERDSVQWNDSAVVSAISASAIYLTTDELQQPIDITGFRRCYTPKNPCPDSQEMPQCGIAGDTLRIRLNDGRMLLCMPFDSLLVERFRQLGLPPDDERNYTADNLLQFRTDSLLVTFTFIRAVPAEHRISDLGIDKIYLR